VDTPCGDPTDTDCDNPDTCDGNSSCVDNLEPVDTPCGDSTATDCTDPDTCDGSGTCESNNRVCAFVTDSSLCPFDVNPDKGTCANDITVCEFDNDVTCQTDEDCSDAMLGDCVENPTNGDDCLVGDDGDACVTAGGSCEQSSQFRTLFTPDSQNWIAYKHNATNPGQYYYNLIYEDVPDTQVVLTVRVAYPFVTQGATPIHVYGDTTTEDGCFKPTSELANSNVQITLEDYQNATMDGVLNCEPPEGVCGPDGSGFCEFDVSLTIPDCGEATCQVYVNTHLDWGFKGNNVDANPCDDTADRYDRGVEDTVFGGWDALVNTATDDGPVALTNCRTFEFQHSDGIDTFVADGVQNFNEFKRIKGVFGLANHSTDGSPVEVGTAVKLVSQDTEEVVKIGSTDDDGYFTLDFKHTGQAAWYDVHLMGSYNLTQAVRLTPNGWAEASFVIESGQGAGGGGPGLDDDGQPSGHVNDTGQLRTIEIGP
jgi:hypothetical protein